LGQCDFLVKIFIIFIVTFFLNNFVLCAVAAITRRKIENTDEEIVRAINR